MIREDEMSELKVDSVAIRDVYGKVWSLPRPNRHHDVIRHMRESGYDGPVNGVDQQGFILSSGQFCRRKAALRVAEKAGQIKGSRTIANVLTSEDLWRSE